MSKSVGLICFLFLMPIALAMALLWAGSGSHLAMTTRIWSGTAAAIRGDSFKERFAKLRTDDGVEGIDCGGGAMI